MNKSVKLFQPPLLDFTSLGKHDNVTIIIHNTQHKFSTDAQFSGTDIIKQPIFGSRVIINNKEFTKLSFGLPFIRFSQGDQPKIKYENKTKFTFNIHYHGLNTTGAIDGTSMESIFGHNTLLGPNVTFQFPKITNNQSLLWYHSHNMFVSMELIASGLLGLLQVVDKKTEWLTKSFQYRNNQILLTALDMDLTSDGTQTSVNLVADENRSNFTVINGTSAVGWSSSKQYINSLFHNTNKNLVKIDILNGSLNWRVFYIGVCDENENIKSFYHVQTDGGLINPKKLKILSIPVASRVGIIVDLNKFKHNIAHLFFYNFDLTELFGTVQTFPDQPTNQSLTGTIPDLNESKDSTPYPSPIPDPGKINQQGESTNLDYPIVPLIPQTNQILENGSIKIPEKFNIKPFLKIVQTEKKGILNMDYVVQQIRKTIFGCHNYDTLKQYLKQPCFEYDPKFNYLALLNKNYFYNLPKLEENIPSRNLFLFFETNTNAFPTNINGTTEYVNNANRIMSDLWNSNELNLESALQQYNQSPNDYKPSVLPTSKFRIYKTNDTFSNTAMISNDTLTIQFFANAITYGDFSQTPLSTVTIVFPSTDNCKSLNLQQWIDLVNQTFKDTSVTIENLTTTLDTILVCDWSFFPYALDFLYQKTSYVKSAVIKTKNLSNYWIRFLGRWPLLQFFGKPMTGNTLDQSNDLLSNLRMKQQRRIGIQDKLQPNNNINKSLYIKCDEFGTYGTHDADIQQIFPFYATLDGNVQLPIACMKRNAELIVAPLQTYIGLYDGYLNDNLNSFSVKLKSTEKWIYTNADNTDAHPLHFHLTSGYALPQSDTNSFGLLDCKRSYDPLIYSKDIYKIGPQETVSFYLTWPHYSSDEVTKTPDVRCIGGVIHCHFLQHNDANSMIIQYFVDRSPEE
jgi:FtsP/CotA-like multicopper oxidase with cupredoxin domain